MLLGDFNATILVADTNLFAGETTTVTVIFSDVVRFADAMLANSQPSLGLQFVTAENGSLTVPGDIGFFGQYKAVWTLELVAAAATDATNVITFDLDGLYQNFAIQSTSGPLSQFATSNNYAVDSTPPTATISLADTAITDGETPTVTFTFSEAVTGFSNEDLTIENGTLSDVASSDGGVTWTATFTPATGTTDATNVISLDTSGVTDIAGNAGTGTTTSDNYSVDANRAPADVALSALTVVENATKKTIVGALTASDADTHDTHTFTLLDDAGGRFAVSGDKIVVADRLGIDFEQAASHSITVRATDQGGKFYDKTFTITLSDVTGENIVGDTRDNFISAGAGIDRLSGGAGADRMSGGDGSDVYYVERTADVVIESNASLATGGHDTVLSSASYALSANVERLMLGGRAEIDGYGNALANLISGNEAANTIDGGLGSDYLTGGAGRDTFRFSSALNGNTNKDFITDFNVADDTLQLSVGTFRGLAVGDLKASAFYAAAGAIKAYDASDRIVYNTTTGDLYYDADGVGGTSAIKFATLRGKPGLSAADFDIVGVV